uniref:Si:zfos-1192g2.3 n=1 Tax=Cyprinus carpio TaxID=7962 RepID=A0A8C1N2Q3_CYPCA
MIAARCFPHRTLLRAAALCSHRSLQRSVFNDTETQKLTSAAAQQCTSVPPAGDITRPAEVSQIQSRAGWGQEFDVALLVSVLKQENASDICVIRVPPELKYTDHMIIVSGSSPRHLSAIAELLLKTVKTLSLTHTHTHTETDRLTDRQTDTHTHTHTHRQTDTHTHRHTQRHTHTLTHTETDRLTHTLTETDRLTHTHRQTDFKFLRKDQEPHVRLEGRDCDDWKCIDFGPMVLHLMLPDTRQTYELEKLWTLRSYDEQLKRIPPETLPSDFIYDITHA